MFDGDLKMLPTFCPKSKDWCHWKVNNDPNEEEKKICSFSFGVEAKKDTVPVHATTHTLSA